MRTMVVIGGEPTVLQALEGTMRWASGLDLRLVFSPLARSPLTFAYTLRVMRRVGLTRVTLVEGGPEILGYGSPQES